MKCFKCGNESEANEKYCKFCGNDLNRIYRCEVCATVVAPGEKLCSNCLKAQKEKSNNTLLKVLIILLCMIIIILLSMGGFWIWCEWQDIFYTKNIVMNEENKGQGADIITDEEDNTKEDDDEIWDKPRFENLRASSEYEAYMTDNGNIYTYYIEQIIDNDHDTAWSPERIDRKPWFKFSDDEEQKVNGIIIENGYSKSEELYYQNLRAKDILIECDDFTMKYILGDFGCGVPETIKFETPVITKKIKITVLSCYDSVEINGIKYEDLSITELEIF